jgi:hypothetical protein
MADTRSDTELLKYARQFLKACSSGWDCYAICNMIRVRFQELYDDQPMSIFEFTVSFKNTIYHRSYQLDILPHQRRRILNLTKNYSAESKLAQRIRGLPFNRCQGTSASRVFSVLTQVLLQYLCIVRQGEGERGCQSIKAGGDEVPQRQ